MMKKSMVLIIAAALLLGGCAQGEKIDAPVPTTPVPQESSAGGPDSLENIEPIVKYDLGQIGGMDMFVDSEYNVHLDTGGGDRVIYADFPDIGLMDPYSSLSYIDYMVKCSEDGQYIFIHDSIYDMEKDQLIPLEGNLIFDWNENKGVYLADGHVFQLGYDGAIYSEFAAGKRLVLFENGVERNLKVAGDGAYFVLDPLYEYDDTLQAAVIKIPVAKLKMEIDALKEMVDSGEYRDLIREEILDTGILDQLDAAYKAVLDQIKALASYKALRESIGDGDMADSEVLRFIDHIEDHVYIYWNTDPSYFYEKIRDAEIIIREHDQSEKEPDLSQGLPEALKADIERLDAYKKLKEDVAAYKKLAPVAFVDVEMLIDMISGH